MAGIISATATTSHQTTPCRMRPQDNLLWIALRNGSRMVGRCTLPKIVLRTETILMTKMKRQKIRKGIKKKKAVLITQIQATLRTLKTY